MVDARRAQRRAETRAADAEQRADAAERLGAAARAELAAQGAGAAWQTAAAAEERARGAERRARELAVLVTRRGAPPDGGRAGRAALRRRRPAPRCSRRRCGRSPAPARAATAPRSTRPSPRSPPRRSAGATGSSRSRRAPPDRPLAVRPALLLPGRPRRRRRSIDAVSLDRPAARLDEPAPARRVRPARRAAVARAVPAGRRDPERPPDAPRGDSTRSACCSTPTSATARCSRLRVLHDQRRVHARPGGQPPHARLARVRLHVARRRVRRPDPAARRRPADDRRRVPPPLAPDHAARLPPRADRRRARARWTPRSSGRSRRGAPATRIDLYALGAPARAAHRDARAVRARPRRARRDGLDPAREFERALGLLRRGLLPAGPARPAHAVGARCATRGAGSTA